MENQVYLKIFCAWCLLQFAEPALRKKKKKEWLKAV